MAQATVDKKVADYKRKLRIETEAKLRMVYAEQALQAAKAGVNSMYEEYTALADEARARQKKLEKRSK